MSKTIDEVWTNHQQWMDSKNNRLHPVLTEYKGFLPPDESPGYVRPGQAALAKGYIQYPIQQIEKEIKGLAEAMFNNDPSHSILEIGLGEFGGTHMLWREIFDKVTTIDCDGELLQRFKDNNALDDRSTLLCGYSTAPDILEQTRDKQYDALFIDGDHSFAGTWSDYSNFKPLIRKGGILGFHDACGRVYLGQREVSNFLDALANGRVDGVKHEVHFLQYSQEVGIAYIYV